MVFWPSSQVVPLVRPVKVLQHMSAFPFDGSMLFGGEVIHARAVPWNYILVWLGISLPEIVLVGLALWVVAMVDFGGGRLGGDALAGVRAGLEPGEDGGS